MRTETETPSSATERQRLQALYEVALTLLSHLQQIISPPREDLIIDYALTLACFMNTSDPWTTPASCEHANNLWWTIIDSFNDHNKKDLQTLLAIILRDKIKPLFAKSKNPAITPAGRKAISPLPAPIEHSMDEAAQTPWKYRDVYIVTVFEWVVLRLDVLIPYFLFGWHIR